MAELATTAVPSGVCVTHGPFAGVFCPACSTAAMVVGAKYALPITTHPRPARLSGGDSDGR